MKTLKNCTLIMQQNYVMHLEEGKDVEEIAKLYGLSKSTVYGRLDEIAKANNRTRESLLVCPQRSSHTPRVRAKKTIVNTRSSQSAVPSQNKRKRIKNLEKNFAKVSSEIEVEKEKRAEMAEKRKKVRKELIEAERTFNKVYVRFMRKAGELDELTEELEMLLMEDEQCRKNIEVMTQNLENIRKIINAEKRDLA